ncbi:uncharacterized protein LOC101165818 isoform X2 [Oryzias latipes]|uniref:uncharacterized protein LOC101165818 isoform X2 n=1 Tax=Oryzias latipes TaxID=8090 RepID=UPI000CE23E9B|nr:uncharacterized protein LOC101165818 isoform X2 [Oryzias latipes]
MSRHEPGVARTMAPQEMLVVRQHNSSINAQKAQLTYKLFLLEKARNTLDQELRNFSKKVYGEVQHALNSSLPASVFSDLTKALDLMLQNILKLSEMLKDLTVDSPVWPVCKNGKRSNNPQTCGTKRMKVSLMPVGIQFGLMLKKSLISRPMANTVQVLVASLSHRCMKPFRLQPALILHDSINEASATSSSHRSKEDKETVFVEKRKAESVCVPPAVAQNHLISEEKPQAPLPPLQALFSENSNPKPLVIWGQGNKVQHQKQTSCQLLHFIKAKTKKKDALDSTVFGRTEGRNEAKNSEISQTISISATYRTQIKQLPTGQTSALASETLATNADNPNSVFSVKRVNPSGNVVYSCMIMTETELWDVGEICTEMMQSETLHNTSEYQGLQNTFSEATNYTENIDRVPQNMHLREPELENSSAHSQTPIPNNVSIPDFEICRFEEAEVVVSHIRSPSAFYIQRADSNEKLQALVKYSEISPSYAEQNCIPDIGTLVMGRFCEKDQWFRAQVIKICGVSPDDVSIEGAGYKSSVKVDVKRLDFGDTCCLSLLNLTVLPAEAAALPLQALQVSLANVMPINGIDWSDEAVGWFKTMTHNRTLYARLYPQKHTVTVELFLEKGKMGGMRRGAPLSMRLAQNGHARHTQHQYTDLVRKRAVEVKARKQHSDWEKYVISCYIQPKK